MITLYPFVFGAAALWWFDRKHRLHAPPAQRGLRPTIASAPAAVPRPASLRAVVRRPNALRRRIVRWRGRRLISTASAGWTSKRRACSYCLQCLRYWPVDGAPCHIAHLAAGGSPREPAASPTIFHSSSRWESTSSVLRPIDPVEPRMMTRFVMEYADDPAGGASAVLKPTHHRIVGAVGQAA